MQNKLNGHVVLLLGFDLLVSSNSEWPLWAFFCLYYLFLGCGFSFVFVVCARDVGILVFCLFLLWLLMSPFRAVVLCLCPRLELFFCLCFFCCGRGFRSVFRGAFAGLALGFCGLRLYSFILGFALLDQ